MTTARSARTSTTLVILGAVAVWTALIVGGAARGIIRHLSKGGSSDHFFGVQFTRISDDNLARIRQYVDRRLAQGGAAYPHPHAPAPTCTHPPRNALSISSVSPIVSVEPSYWRDGDATGVGSTEPEPAQERRRRL